MKDTIEQIEARALPVVATTENNRIETHIVRHRIKIPELPVLVKSKRKNSLSIEFPIEKNYVSVNKFTQPDARKKEISVFHIYPKLSDWPARQLPDAPNPRSHDSNCVKTPIAKAIEETLKERPEEFQFINRGLTVLAESFEYKNGKAIITISDPENHGVADGAHSDAVISKVQEEVKRDLQLEPDKRNPLLFGRVRVEIVVGITDRDKISWLVEGRNSSRQVKQWSLSEFRGHFDWLKEIIDAENSPFRDKIGWEENSSKDLTVLDLLSMVTLFHKEWNELDNEGKMKAPIIAYANKGKLDARLTSEEAQAGYKALAPLLPDILKLYDYIYVGFEAAYDKAFKGKTRLGRRAGFESRQLGQKHKLPLTGSESNYVIENGILYPLLASFRALVRYGKDGLAHWKRNPFTFFDENGSKLVALVIEQLENVGNTPNALGKNKMAYIALQREVSLLISKEE